MFAIFFDEFGHVQPYRSVVAGDATHNPVFGYGGIVVPGANVAAFATHFFDLKTYAMRNMLVNKHISDIKRNGQYDPRFSEREYLRSLPHDAVMKDKRVRRFCAKYEVKGEEVFSRSYVVKQLGIRKSGDAKEAAIANRKIRGFFNFMRAFLKLLPQHGVQPIYFGVEKRRYQASDFQTPHLKFIPEIMRRSFRLAQRQNSTATVFIDRHHTDGREDELGRRPRGRVARAREIVLAQRLSERITEPLIPFHSDESQCIQAADWVCYLYSQSFPFLCGKHQWRRYRTFFEVIEPYLISGACEESEFRFFGRSSRGKDRQYEIDFNLPPQEPIFGPRPYFN